MANRLSTKKRMKQNVTRQVRNRARKSEVKTAIKAFLTYVHDNEFDLAKEQLRKVSKRLDQFAAKGTYHSRTASRKKSRLALHLNKAMAKAQPTS